MLPWTCLRPTVDVDLPWTADAMPGPIRNDDAGGQISDEEEIAADDIDTSGGAHAGIAGALQCCASAAIFALRNPRAAAARCREDTTMARFVILAASSLTFIVSSELLYAAATQPGEFSAGQNVGVAICSLLMPVSAATALSSTRIAKSCCPNLRSRDLHPLPV